jgi:hypothetical protein
MSDVLFSTPEADLSQAAHRGNPNRPTSGYCFGNRIVL